MLLLDTHAALWWWRMSPLLSVTAYQAIRDATRPFVSAASAFEVSIKHRIGKLDDIRDPAIKFPALMIAHNFGALAVTEPHALRAGRLPGDHGDPFDRLIAAQALEEGLTVVTRDPAFVAFGCTVLW